MICQQKQFDQNIYDHMRPGSVGLGNVMRGLLWDDCMSKLLWSDISTITRTLQVHSVNQGCAGIIFSAGGAGQGLLFAGRGSPFFCISQLKSLYKLWICKMHLQATRASVLILAFILLVFITQTMIQGSQTYQQDTYFWQKSSQVLI